MTSGRVASKAKPKASVPATLGQRIRLIRKAWGWTQTDLGKAIGSPQNTISDWEKDQNRPSGAAILALSRILRVTPEQLEQGRGFTIPAAPGDSGGAQMSKRDIKELRHILPGLKQGEILQVDTQTEDAALVQLSQALQAIREARKQGRQVWLVIGELPKKDDA